MVRTLLKGKMAQASIIIFIVRAASVVIAFVTSVFLARTLGPDQYGIYAFVMALISILLMAVQVGLPTINLRETAVANSKRDWGSLIGIWRWSSMIAAAGSVIILAATLLLVFLFPNVLEPSKRTALLYALPLVPLLAFTEICVTALRGLKWLVMGSIPGSLLRPLIFLLLLVALDQSGQLEASAETATLANTIGGVCILVFAITSLLVLRPKEVREPVVPVYQNRRWLNSIIPLTLIVGLQTINHNTDIVMLGSMAGDTDVGAYRVALSIATVAVFGLVVIDTVLQPRIAESHAKGDTSELQRIVSKAALFSFLTTIPALLVIVLFGQFLLPLIYGPGYGSAFAPLLILILAQSINAFFGPVGSVLSMTGFERSSLLGLAIAAAVNVTLNVILIPPFGVVGAATATGLSIVTWNVLFCFFAFRHVGIDCTPVSFLLSWVRQNR